MSTWVIPYSDQPLDFWEEMSAAFGSVVKEVYFPISIQVVGSGRSPQPDLFTTDFLRQAPFAKSVLVNPIILPGPLEAVAPPVLGELRRLYDIYGVSSVTVTNLGLARLIREKLPMFRITASILMGISTPTQALIVQPWVDAIVPDNRLLRDLPNLTRLREAFRGDLRLIVNESCIPGCPYRTQHFFEMGYGDWFPQSLCGPMLDDQPWLRLTGAWILPRHLPLYAGLYDSLKLSGRVAFRDAQKYKRVLDAYVHGKPLLPSEIGGGPASLLDPIDIPDEVFTYTLTCDKNCHRCSVCKNAYERAWRG